eukprot:tig00021622_g22994.t1
MDADSWLSQEVRLYDNAVEGASWTLGEIDFPVEGAEVVIRSLPFVRWIDDWAGAVRANERDAAGDTPMVEATAAASASSAAAAGPSEPPAPDPQAPPGSRTWYDGTLERLRYCEKYCVLLPDPLGAGSATNTLASTVLGNVEGHNRGIPAAILLYGPPVPPTPTTLEGADVQGLPYVLAMMGLDEHITKWVSSEPALPLREDGPITKAYATLNTVMHHTCRMSYAYLHRPHQFNPHAGPNRAPPRSRVVAFKDPRFGRKFGIRVVAQADSRVRMLVPGEPVLSSERAFAAELDANALDVLGDAAGRTPSASRWARPRRDAPAAGEPDAQGDADAPARLPIVTENGATWAPLPTREFVASLLAGYVNHLAGWILGHELPEPRRPAPVAGYNVQMHVVGPTAAYEFLRDICYRGDRNTLSADKRGSHMRTVDGDELYAVYHTVKDKVPTDIVDEPSRPTAVATSWLDNAPASKKQLADAMLQIWGLPATTQLRALLAKHEDTVGCLDVRLLERILPARTTAHGMREFCHVDRDTWAAGISRMLARITCSTARKPPRGLS